MLHMHRYKRHILIYERTQHPHANIAAGGPERHQTQMNTTHHGAVCTHRVFSPYIQLQCYLGTSHRTRCLPSSM